MNYRLLDVGEPVVKGDEICTATYGWRVLEDCWIGECLDSPIRRIDDGKGKFLLSDVAQGTEFWRYGTGWWIGSGGSEKDVWRKARDVMQKPCSEPSSGGWLVINYNETPVVVDSEQEAVEKAKEFALRGGDDTEYSVAKVTRTFRCSITVVEEVIQ